MTTPLSPAAQEIDDAFWKTIKDKWNIYDRRRAQLAAALRALAMRINGADAIRQDVLDIAAEIEAQ
jgi:hypothetical protein